MPAQVPDLQAVPTELEQELAPRLSMAQATHELELPAITTHHKTREEVFKDLLQASEPQITEDQASDPQLSRHQQVDLQEGALAPS